MHYRTQLFVPGNRPERFEKACAAGADLVCIDLEDAVSEGEKDKAREFTFDFLERGHAPNVSLRINPPDTDAGKADIKALRQCGFTLPFIMAPKASDLAQMTRLDKALPKALGPLFVIIESAAGVINCAQIFSHPRVGFGMYGAIDYAGDTGCDMSWETHLFARSHCVAAASAHNVTLFEGPFTDVRDNEACEISTRRSKGLGLLARSAIHPAQIPAILAGLAPSRAEIEQARRVIDAYDAAGGNAALLDGKFIEIPVVKSARRILSHSA
ncbi:MAG: CoA ester lyase [Robiginitomaculum sp.]